MVKNRFSQKQKWNLIFWRKMRFLTKKCNFWDFLEILSQSSETHISYHYNIKMGRMAPKSSAKFLTVKMQVLQKFVYQLF